MRWTTIFFLVLGCVGLVGCSSGGDDSVVLDAGGADGDAGSDAFVVGPHEAFPRIPNQGGPSFAEPTLVTVSFASAPDGGTGSGGATEQQIIAFGDWVVASSWLAQVGKDYGVGPGTHLHATLPAPTTTTLTDADVQSLVAARIQDGSLPHVDGGSGEYVYELFFPVGTTILLDGMTTCVPYKTDFEGGYHGEVASPHVAYAVIPTCSDTTTVESLTSIESSASHELIEAATDPFPYSAPAWALEDLNNPWTYLSAEVADLCDTEDVQVDGHEAQRVWSNSAAAAGTNPCIPAPPGPFYDSTPSPSVVQHAKAGQTITLAVEGFSTAPTPPWSISVFTGGGTFDPAPQLSASTLGNGDTATLTMTVPAGTPHGGFALVFLDSARSASDYSFWPVVVDVP